MVFSSRELGLGLGLKFLFCYPLTNFFMYTQVDKWRRRWTTGSIKRRGRREKDKIRLRQMRKQRKNNVRLLLFIVVVVIIIVVKFLGD